MPVHKKGSKMKCENYRGISLLSIPSKVNERTRCVTEDRYLRLRGALERAEGYNIGVRLK